jgi:GNAT superfamily N-acetyltransferase
MGAIRVVTTDEEIQKCFPVMHQLRPHLKGTEFLRIVRRQQSGGYRLVALDDEERVRAVAGFRLIENLARGRLLYIDDIVTDEGARSRGHGKALLAWLIEQGRKENCHYLELNSGVIRVDAHRFYFANRMAISSYQFRLQL